jgi:putative membrane protein
MKSMGSVLALAGIALAVLLFAREDVRAIVGLVVAAGPGLVVASLVHVVPMTLNARAWQLLFARSARPALRVVTLATWVRESVNGLLPVARIGGEVAAFRIVRRAGAGGADGAASLIADMTLSLVSQAVFAAVGVAFLVVQGRASALTADIVAAVALLMVAGVVLALALSSNVLSGLTRFVDRLVVGRLDAALAGSVRIDQALRALQARRRDVAACFAWQLAAWVVGASEIWLALHFLGHPRSVLDAFVIEALIQAVSSAAFVVPGALGVQEGAFLVIGAMLSIDGPTALALASARRIRDLVVFFPGLVVWHRAESRASGQASARLPEPQ